MLHPHYNTDRQMIIPQRLKCCPKPANFIRWFKGSPILKNLVSATRKLQLSIGPQVPLEMEADPFSQSRYFPGEERRGEVFWQELSLLRGRLPFGRGRHMLKWAVFQSWKC